MRLTLLFSLILAIAFGAIPAAAQQEAAPIQAPETIQEAQEFGFQILQGLPKAVKNVWDTQAMPLWQKMWSTVKNIWDTTVFLL